MLFKGYPGYQKNLPSLTVFSGCFLPLSGRPDKIKDINWSEVKNIRTLTDERGSLMTLLR